MRTTWNLGQVYWAINQVSWNLANGCRLLKNWKWVEVTIGMALSTASTSILSLMATTHHTKKTKRIWVPNHSSRRCHMLSFLFFQLSLFSHSLHLRAVEAKAMLKPFVQWATSKLGRKFKGTEADVCIIGTISWRIPRWDECIFIHRSQPRSSANRHS